MVSDLGGTASRLWREAPAWRLTVIGAGMLSVVAALHILSGRTGGGSGAPGPPGPPGGPGGAVSLPSDPASDARLADYEAAYATALKVPATGERCDRIVAGFSSLTTDDKARGRNVIASSKARIAAIAAGQTCSDSIRVSDTHFQAFERLVAAAETQPSSDRIQAAADASSKLDTFDQSRARYAGESALLQKAKGFASEIAASEARVAAAMSAAAAFAAGKSATTQAALAGATLQLTDFDRGRLTDAQRRALEVGSQAVAELNASRARLAKLAELVHRTQNGATPQLGQQLLDATTAVSASDEAVATPEQMAALAKARLTARQLAWSLLDTRVHAEDASGETAEAATGIAAAYGLLKDVPSDGLSRQQQTLLERGRAAVQSLADSDARLSALLAAAERWQRRNGSVEPGTLPAYQAITDFDRRRFKDGHRAAWNLLARAEAIIRGPELGLTAATKAQVPIYVFTSGKGDLNELVAAKLKSRLQRAGFQTVEGRNDAALIIDVAVDHMDEPTEDFSDGVKYRTEAHLTVNAMWVADQSSFMAEAVSEEAVVSDRWGAKTEAILRSIAAISERFDRLVK